MALANTALRQRAGAAASSAPRCSCISRTRPVTKRSTRSGIPERQFARQQHSLLVAQAANEPSAAPIEYEEPDRAKEAIDLGLKYTNQGRWGEALPIFERALKLPGTGLKRFRDKPPLISDGEKGAALYNIACCHAQLGDARSALVALSGCLETGYADFAQIRSDPDLVPLRSDERFDGLLARFEPKNSGGFFGALFGRK